MTRLQNKAGTEKVGRDPLSADIVRGSPEESRKQKKEVRAILN